MSDSSSIVMNPTVHKKFLRVDRDPPTPEEGNGGSFRVYINAKKRKIGHQFLDHQARRESAGTEVFSGVTIHVNGYTKPSHQVAWTFFKSINEGCSQCCLHF